METIDSEKLDRILHDGYCRFENVLPPDMVERLRAVTDEVLAQQDEAHFNSAPSAGSMVSVTEHPFMAQLIAHPRALAVLAELGFDDPKFMAGYIISKPPHSPPLFWHQDGLFWGDPVSYTTQPQQWFLMYYLVDTTPENGCLRVIPGSHLHRHRLHDQVEEVWTRQREDLIHIKKPEHAAFKRAEGEVDVPVRAGDLVIGDARLFHAAHANRSDRRRTNITLWFFPAFSDLPEPIQAYVVQKDPMWPEAWMKQVRALMEPLRPVYTGAAEPIEGNRTPGPQLK